MLRQPPAADIVDCDVHPNTERGLQCVYPYMTPAWRERFHRKGAHRISAAPTVRYTHPNGSIQREDARPEGGRPAGSDPRLVINELITEHCIAVAILNSLQASVLSSALANTAESIPLVSAFNDYLIDKWLTCDQRFRLAATVAVQDPSAAVEEISRIGNHPQVAAIAVPLADCLLGNRRLWPIYQEAEKHSLPILIHGSGAEGVFQGAPSFAGGVADSYVERFLSMTPLAESNLTSLIFSGTLERFPRLKFVFAEFGFTWLVPLLWRMERMWRNLRHEVPWVKRSPIEYVHGQCRFTTQPLDEPEQPAHLDLMIGLLGEDHLCFSSDYPHWDNEMPGQVLGRLSADARAKIFGGNARRTFRLS